MIPLVVSLDRGLNLHFGVPVRSSSLNWCVEATDKLTYPLITFAYDEEETQFLCYFLHAMWKRNEEPRVAIADGNMYVSYITRSAPSECLARAAAKYGFGMHALTLARAMSVAVLPTQSVLRDFLELFRVRGKFVLAITDSDMNVNDPLMRVGVRKIHDTP